MRISPIALPRYCDVSLPEKPEARDMGDEAREIEGPGGPYRIRAARPADEAFQFALFRARRAGMFQLAGLPASMIDNLLSLQYRARGESYRGSFPDARWSIVECAGEPIGELIIDEDADALHIVDITLAPDRQGRGIGPLLLRAFFDHSVSRGGIRAIADVGNMASRKMFARLGFVESPCGDEANVELRWRP
jgi:ribosomal protein S18 acetylase RimI-like enzyme